MEFTQKAKRDIAEINRLGGGALPVCISKTQYSLSDNPALLGRPIGFKIPSAMYICAPAPDLSSP